MTCDMQVTELHVQTGERLQSVEAPMNANEPVALLIKTFYCKVTKSHLALCLARDMAIRRSETKGGLTDGSLAPKKSIWSIRDG